MKKIILITILTMAVLTACNKPKHYTSLGDYPVYKGNDLELTYSPSASLFKVWSPNAEAVKLNIYDSDSDQKPSQIYQMKTENEGTWSKKIREDLLGKFYTFQIEQNGKWLAETPGIWAKAVGINGDRAAIIDMSKTNPEGWDKDKRPALKNFTDAVIYEVHYRDFSSSPTSGSKYPGKFLSLCESGTHSPEGLSTGLDHLKKLGINAVQILPSYDFGSIDETKLDQNKYNWGYDPKNYNVPDGSYCTNPSDPSNRIYEMKKMVETLHQNGIRVIMDVVYNHTYIGQNSHLNLLVPNYFYRFNPDGTWSNGSGCGNEIASERPMVRRYIVESVKYWAQEYHIDGFRFDLMGVLDIETMNAIRTALDSIDSTITMHGEGWSAGACAIPDSLRALKQNAPAIAPIAVFSDDLRDALRGSWTEGDKGGFLAGNGYKESLKFGIVGATEHPDIDLSKIVHANTFYAISPEQVINYVSCHDDPCLTDKLRATLPNASEQELLAIDKLAQTVVLTSQGVPFIFAGEEMFRNKKGVHNSYESPDSINVINWNYKSKYHDLFEYYKNLIALRKAHPAFRMTTADMIRKNLHFINVNDSNVVAYTLNNHANGDKWQTILVVFNGNRKSIFFSMPQGKWQSVCYNGEINSGGIKTMMGNIQIPASSAAIFYNE